MMKDGRQGGESSSSLVFWSRGAVPEGLRHEEEDKEEAETNDNSDHPERRK